MEKKTDKPIIYKIEESRENIDALSENISANDKQKELLLEYPVVYIHNWMKTGEYEVYIGEANDVIKRTRQHYDMGIQENSWQRNLIEKQSVMYIIGHEHFNKSLTLDIENRLMNYMLGVKKVCTIHNKRENPQKKYYPSDESDIIFRKIWMRLGRENSELFPKAKLVTDSAIFKASPLHNLTEEQEIIKEAIVQKVQSSLEQEGLGKIIFVSGEAGTGKTVLNSSLFYELCFLGDEEVSKRISCHLLVNHEEQLTVYQQIAKKLNLGRGQEVVSKPTTFINHFSKDNPVDVVLIDEAHLLLTRGKQSYVGKNQLSDIRERAKVVVVMFDKRQILRTEQYWEAEIISQLEEEAKESNCFFKLERQLRITGNKETVDWINRFTKEQMVDKIPMDKDYEIKILDTPEELEVLIKEKAKNADSKLSRMIATFDWEYNRKKSPNNRLKRYWEVTIGKWRKPWNLQLKGLPENRRMNRGLAWAEQSHTIDEVGSTYTIQGFDLSYAGVILGPSVKYRDGKVVFEPENSKNRSATSFRKLSDGTKRKFGETLICNEVNVLMTRGVQGLYIFAVDEELRRALQDAAVHRKERI